MPPKKTKEAPAATMEVPKTLNVRINDGVIESTDKRGGTMNLVFKHVQATMNDKNSMDILKALASLHGVAVEVST